MNRAVAAYFEDRGKNPAGGPRLWLKTGLVCLWAAASYVFLVFFAQGWWQVFPAAASLGLAVAGIGFNVQHDGGHGAFSGARWLNRLTAKVLDLVGGSSYVWRFKHNFLHHHYTNIDEVDNDLHAEPFLRLAPAQRRRWYHRLQYLFVWPLYLFFLPKWQWIDDFVTVAKGRIQGQQIPRPKGADLVWLIAGKALFFGWALVLPLFLHPVIDVLLIYGFICLVGGITLATVFQLAHCVEEAHFESQPEAGDRVPRPWAEHQLATTVDFSPHSRLLCWYLGGLNFQVVHHLFPRVSHVHYPALAPIVDRVCREHGVRYRSHPTLRRALVSHMRHLRKMGRPDVAA